MTFAIKKLHPFGVAVEFTSAPTLSVVDKKVFQDLIAEHGLVVLRGIAAPTKEDFLAFCTSLPDYSCDPLCWDFGPVMDLRYQPDAKNYLFSLEKVPFHWDGAFFKEPAILAFQCLEAPEVRGGGETIFCNTANLVADLPAQDLVDWCGIRLEFKTEKVAHYGGSVCAPLVQSHPLTKRKVLRLAEPVETKLNPVSMKVVSAQPDHDRQVVESLIEKAYAKAYCYEHSWQSGDLLFADNYTLIHGRRAFKEDSSRWIRRVQIMHKT